MPEDMLMAEAAEESLKRWRREIEASPPPRQPPTTVSGVPIDALYTPRQAQDLDDAEDVTQVVLLRLWSG